MIIFLMSFWLFVVIVKNTFKSKQAKSPRKLIIKNKLISNKLTSSWDSYPPAINDIGRFKFKTAANSFQMCLDLDHGTLSFLVDGKFLGFAYDNLINKTLKPVIISSAKAKIQMRYRGNFNGRF